MYKLGVRSPLQRQSCFLFLILYFFFVVCQYSGKSLCRVSLPSQPCLLVRIIRGLDPLYVKVEVALGLRGEHKPNRPDLPGVQRDLVVLHVPLVRLEKRTKGYLRWGWKKEEEGNLCQHEGIGGVGGWGDQQTL